MIRTSLAVCPCWMLCKTLLGFLNVCPQLQEFEEALKQRDEIITQLTANMQQARTEKEEVMREFLQLTEQSQKLQIQFQQVSDLYILNTEPRQSATVTITIIMIMTITINNIL